MIYPPTLDVICQIRKTVRDHISKTQQSVDNTTRSFFDKLEAFGNVVKLCVVFEIPSQSKLKPRRKWINITAKNKC